MTDHESKRKRDAERAARELQSMANVRPLYACEHHVGCPQSGCGAMPGQRCTFTIAGKKRRQISVWAHIERKQAHGRKLKIEVARDVLARGMAPFVSHPPQLAALADELAEHIVDALHAHNERQLQAAREDHRNG